jgi:hypothetical protein
MCTWSEIGGSRGLGSAGTETVAGRDAPGWLDPVLTRPSGRGNLLGVPN